MNSSKRGTPPDCRALRICMGMLSTTGGSSIVARELGEGLRRLGFETRYCHLNDRDLRDASDFHVDAAAGIASSALLDVPPSMGGANDAASALLRVYDQWPFDLFHLHNLQVYGQPAMLLEALRGTPYVVTCHGSDVLNEHLMDRNRDVVSLILRRARAVTCVSEYLASALRQRVPELARIEVIPNFLRAAWRDERIARRPEPGRYLHVSSLRAVKRPELLLEAFARMRAARADARLSVVTTANGMRRLRDLAGGQPSGCGIDAFDGEADPGALHREYARACALLLTSRFEGFGLVVLEALAYGVPVVAPRIGALPEVLGEDWPLLVDDDGAGSLVRAALHAFDGGGVSARRIREVADRFDGPRQIARYAQLYQRVLVGGAFDTEAMTP